MEEQLELPGVIDENQEPWKIEIQRECNPENPRSWDNLGKFFVAKNRYVDSELEYINDLSFEEIKDKCISMDNMQEYIEKQGYVALPLCVYDHSSWTVYVGNPCCKWDSGYIGFYVVSKEDIRKQYKVKRVSSKLLENINKSLNTEVKTFDQYVQGEVYGFVATKPSLEKEGEEIIDSCFGFYGETEKEIIKSMLDYLPVSFKNAEEALKHVTFNENC